MSAPALPRDLRPEKYQRLATLALGPRARLGLFSPAGGRLWCPPDAGEALAPEVVRAARAGDAGRGAPAAAGAVSAVALDTGPEAPVLAIAAPGADAGTRAAALAALARCLADELRLTRELDDMAEELAARYEELNLVYRLEEQAPGYHPAGGRDALMHLVEDCAAHLGLAAAGFYLPAEEIDVTCFPAADVGLATFWRQARDPLLLLAREAKASAVINDPRDPRRALLGDRTPWRIAAAPVLDLRGDVAGILAVVKAPEAGELATGDRKLLEVLAEQAAAVLQSSRDQLTGLLNRGGLEHRLRRWLDDRSGPRRRGALVHLDLDRFKLVNESSGRVAGDELLKQIAGVLDACTRQGDLVARLGADEFAVLVRDCGPVRAERAAAKLVESVREHRFWWDGKLFAASASAGVVPLETGCGVEPADLLATAEMACLIAKEEGHGRPHVFVEGDRAFAAQHDQMRWVPRINEALERGRFRLVAQVIRPVDPLSGEPAHLELLLRYVDDEGALVGPHAFLPAAERYRLMPAIDRWVIAEALAGLHAHRDLVEATGVVWTVNVSGQSLAEPDLFDFVCREAARRRIALRHLCVEITETAAVASFTAARELMGRLARRGCRFALDDFGTGLSSFSYLKSLPVDYLKIDGGFVREIDTDPVSEAMVASIQQIGSVMGLKTIAEFVETEAVLARLRALGVDFAQGYAIARPCDLDEALASLAPGGAAPSAAPLPASAAL